MGGRVGVVAGGNDPIAGDGVPTTSTTGEVVVNEADVCVRLNRKMNRSHEVKC